MMINKRLIGTVPDSKPYIAGNVALQWLSLLSNAGMIFSCAWFLQQLLEGAAAPRTLALPLAAGLAAVLVRGICTAGAGRMSFLAARSVKRTLRRSIYEKLLRLGPAYSQNVATSEAVQLAAEGVEQLETYFGAYLPQFFYSMLAPATLFALLAPVSLRAALALLVCVPLIPAAIAAGQTFAKKLLGRYWGQYTALGDTFLENLQGLTTLKIYQADGYKQEEMNREAEKFRRITMKVLTMQLNSITIMDLVAYGGAALGYTMQMPEEEKYLNSRDELLVELRTMLGGRAAEQTVFGIETTGASNDIERATDLARKMVMQYGMSDRIGLMALTTKGNEYLDGQSYTDCAQTTAAAADEEVRKLLNDSYDQAKKILTENRGLLDEVALYLLQKETITGDELMQYVDADKRLRGSKQETLPEAEA